RAEDLHKTYSLANDEDGFTFPILADETLATFKAFRAFDDFETMPLHGTFLIDAGGLVRWQDISFQPFTQAKWLLAESKRLLALLPATAKSLTSNPTHPSTAAPSSPPSPHSQPAPFFPQRTTPRSNVRSSRRP